MEALQTKTIFSINQNNELKGNIQGLVLAVVVGVLAHNLTNVPLLSIPGPMVIAILVGMAWRAVMGIPEHAGVGISLASKKLLRFGIILMGVRLNLLAVLGAGPEIILLDAGIIILAISVICYLGKMYGVEKNLTFLTAIGTGICGAAAISAISPLLIKSDEDDTVVSIATVAILGTITSILYIVLEPYLGLDLKEYGIFAGATLHEVAHAVAASQPLGTTAGDMAILTKLGRVAFLIPVTLIVSLWVNFKEQGASSKGIKQMVIPWFIFGFLAMSCLNTAGYISKDLAAMLLQASGLLLTVAMAGMGLSVDLATFRRKGMKSLAIGFAGTVVISITGLFVVKLIG